MHFLAPSSPRSTITTGKVTPRSALPWRKLSFRDARRASKLNPAVPEGSRHLCRTAHLSIRYFQETGITAVQPPVHQHLDDRSCSKEVSSLLGIQHDRILCSEARRAGATPLSFGHGQPHRRHRSHRRGLQPHRRSRTDGSPASSEATTTSTAITPNPAHRGTTATTPAAATRWIFPIPAPCRR